MRNTAANPHIAIGDKLIIGRFCAIVSSRSVVVADVPAYSIVGGYPARVIRQRFDADVVKRLESLAWWDWPVDVITRHLRLIVSADVDALVAVAPDR